MIKIAIISDIRLYREGIGRILDNVKTINVVGVADCHNEILDLLENNHIDIVLIDMRMGDGSAILSSITQNCSHAKIIVIALPENDKNYLLCAQSGVSGYLSKESAIDELVDAIITVAKGSLYCPCDITEYILKSVRHKHDNKIKDTKPAYSKLFDALTRREIQIVKLLAEGMSNKKIATTLTIELSTVKNHVHNILVKMGIDSRSQVAYLLQQKPFPSINRSLDLDPQIDLP